MNAGSTSTGVRHIKLLPDLQSAHRARAFVHETLLEWGCQNVEEAVTLAVSELVTNAVVHAQTDTSLTLIDSDEGVQIRVKDDTPSPPLIRYVSVEETCGRGLAIVEALSDHWGVESAPPGKIIWLDISKT